MLILSRQSGESVLIGDDVRISVLEISANGFVRLGIEAPKDVDVDREEVRRSKRAAPRGAKPENGGR